MTGLPPPPPPDPPLTPAEEIAVAGTINASFQVATQQADSKVSMLLVVHSGIAVVVSTHLREAVALVASGGAAGLTAVPLLAAVMVGFLISGYHLMQGLRPRLIPPAPDNRFAFPAVATGALGGPEAPAAGVASGRLRAEAWESARRLAEIAMVKNQHVVRALNWMALMVLAALAAMTLVTLAG